ncbi:hypothetical protein KCM76_22405, partial [Zooshikella marina]
NLTQREDKRQKIHETFAYDQLNRLTEVTAKLSSNTLTTSVQYDALGNITHKSDVGDYQYADKCGSQQAGPHALTKTTGSQNATYCYDANGNMTSGNGRTVRYTAFDKPDQIIRGDHQIDLVYGPDQKRVRRIDQGPTGTSTTYYQSGIYEKVVSDTGKIQHKHYIGEVAIITKTENAGTEDGTKTNYFHRDHLSSITAITDQNGQVIERFSYDPWGKRRQTDWQAAIDFTQITSTITKRGFTDHEHLDGVGLIHMNGRVYDPNVGRFLSADPFIQFESNLQSYNRYSYGLNNPLNGSDPTGFLWEDFTNWLSNIWGSSPQSGAPIEAYNNGGSENGPADNSYITPLRAEYQPQKELNYGEQIANDVMNHYNQIGRGESNTTDGSDLQNRRMMTPLRRENFGRVQQPSYNRAQRNSDPDIGGYSPVGGEYYNENGDLVSVEVASYGGLVSSDGLTAYDFDHESGLLVNPRATGAVGNVCAIACLAPIAKGLLLFRSSYVTVTSWAAAGQTADLAAGRWVMIGGATRWNFIRTGLWGPQMTVRPFSFSWGAGQSAFTPVTGQVLRSRVGLGPGLDGLKGALFGQRYLRY